MKRKKVFSFALLFVLVVAVVVAGCIGGGGTTQTQTSPGASTSTYHFKIELYTTSSDFTYNGLQEWIELVKTLTNNRVEIELYQAGEIVEVPQLLNAVSQGTLDMACLYMGYWGQEPILVLSSSKPGPISTPLEAYYEWTMTKDLVKEVLEKKYGVIALGPVDAVNPELILSNKPIKSLADLKGKIVRTAGLATEFFKRLGAEPVTLPVGEIYTALQTGTISAIEWADFITNYKSSWYDFAPYVIKPTPGVNLHSAEYYNGVIVVNSKVWNNLPSDIKAAMEVATDAVYLHKGLERWILEARYEKKWKETVGEDKVVEIPPEEREKVIDIAMEIYKQYAQKDPKAYEYCTRLVKVWRDLGYSEWADKLDEVLRSIPKP